MSREQTSMDDLLSRRQVDEKERSPDDQGSIAESSEPEAFQSREAFTDTDQQEQPRTQEKPEPRSKSVKDDDDGGADSESRRMSGLPKWAYMRLQANNQKAEAAERRAAEIERELQALKSQRQPVQDEEDAEETWDQWTTKKVDSVAQQMERQNWEVRNNFGWKLALQQHGQELPTQAAAWANDRAKADPDFARRVYQAPDPVDYSITEFKKAQFADEAEKFGWDLDKLVQARAGKQQTQQTQPQPAAGDRTGAVSQPQTETRYPSDFASTGSGAGRVNGDAGPTPLSDLLSINSRRR